MMALRRVAWSLSPALTKMEDEKKRGREVINAVHSCNKKAAA